MKKIIVLMLCFFSLSKAAEPKFKVGEFVLLKETGRPWLADYKGLCSIGVIRPAIVVSAVAQEYWVASCGGQIGIRMAENEITQITDPKQKEEVEARWKALYVHSIDPQ